MGQILERTDSLSDHKKGKEGDRVDMGSCSGQLWMKEKGTPRRKPVGSKKGGGKDKSLKGK